MNFDPQTYEELIRMKRCVELTKYYELTEEELEEIYRFLEQNPEASVKGGRQNLALIRLSLIHILTLPTNREV